MRRGGIGNFLISTFLVVIVVVAVIALWQITNSTVSSSTSSAQKQNIDLIEKFKRAISGNHDYSSSGSDGTDAGTLGDGGGPGTLGGVTSYKVFVTSQAFTGNLGGLEGADLKCQSAADSAGIGGIWKAFIGTEEISPQERLFQSTLPYVRLDGVKIADDWNDLSDGSIDEPINVTELGGGARLFYVWTGSSYTANYPTNAHPYSQSCENWNIGSGLSTCSIAGTTADWRNSSMFSPDPSRWEGLFCSQCNYNLNHLYCIEQPSQQTGICGNGIIEVGEDCDDGNIDAGDGCDSDCVVETGYVCINEPSVCGLRLSVCNTTLNQANKRYILANDILGFNSGSTKVPCFRIAADNITLEGNRKTIQEDTQDDYGVYAVGVRNATIQNLNISGFWEGIYLISTNYSLIENNQIDKSDDVGVYMDFCEQNTVKDNVLNLNKYGGVQCINKAGTKRVNVQGYHYIVNNTLNKNEYMGITLHNCSSNRLEGNNMVENRYNGIVLTSYSNSNVLTQNTISGSNDTACAGIMIYASSSNQLNYNTVTLNRYGDPYYPSCLGIDISTKSTNNALIGNNVQNNDAGIRVTGSSNGNFLINNLVNLNTNSINNSGGIVIVGSNYTTVVGNTIDSNNDGMQIYSPSKLSNVTGNIISRNTGFGVYFINNPSGNLIISNTDNGQCNILGGVYPANCSGNICAGNIFC